MSWTPRRRTLAEIATVALWAAVSVASAQAADLYRWTDASGGTHYGDKPPKGALNVTRIEVDTAGSTMPSRPPPAAPAAPAAPRGEAASPPAPDLLTQRRATRARLEGNIAAAQARLDLARKNLAEANELQPDEQQVVQQRLDNAPPGAGVGPGKADATQPQGAHGGMMGLYPNRSNCTTSKGANGKAVTVCPTIIPNQAYQERIAALEDAVRKAEEDLAAAETAYRRGVD